MGNYSFPVKDANMHGVLVTERFQGWQFPMEYFFPWKFRWKSRKKFSAEVLGGLTMKNNSAQKGTETAGLFTREGVARWEEILAV